MAEEPGKTSRYAQVAAELRTAILSGQLPPGVALPSESRLAAQHGASRPIVRNALAILRAEGLITTVKGGSTYIRDRRAVRLPLSRYSRALTLTPFGPFEASARECGLTGTTKTISVTRQPADADAARSLAIPEGAEVFVRVRHMSLGDVEPEVVQVSTSIIPAALAEGTPLAGNAKITGGVYAALVSLGHAPAYMTESVLARMPTPQEVAALGLAPGMPVLVAVRATRDAEDRPIELLRVVATADRTEFVYDDLPIAPVSGL